MTQEAIISWLENHPNGTIRTIEYEKTLKTRKGITDVVTKKVKMQVQLGCHYDNKASVKAKRASGELPETNQGLKQGEWINRWLIRSTTGKILLAVYPVHNGNRHTMWYRNGASTTIDKIAPLCLASETRNSSSIDMFTLNIENIISIH